MANQLLVPPKFRPLDDNGAIIPGGKLYSYLAGTTTPEATKTSYSGGSNANPVILDGNGEADVWLDTAKSYKLELRDADDVVLWTVDNVSATNDGSIVTAKLADGSVTTVKIADGNVTTAKLDDLAVTAAKLAANAVTTTKILDGAVTAEKIDPSIDFTQFFDTVEMVNENLGDFDGPPIQRNIPIFPWTSPAPVTNPGTLPAGNATGVAFSPNNEFMAVSHATTPYVSVYQRRAQEWKKVNPSMSLGGTANGAAFSKRGDYLALPNTSSYMSIWQRRGADYEEIFAVTQVPAAAHAAAWSPNGEFLAVAHANSPYITIYQRTAYPLAQFGLSGSNNVMGAVANIGATVNQASVNAVIADINSQLVELYDKQKLASPLTVFTKLSNPGTLPSADCRSVAWSPDGRFLAVGHAANVVGIDDVLIYERSGTTFTALSIPSLQGTIYSMQFSPNGEFLAICADSAVFLLQRSGSTFTQLSNLNNANIGTNKGVSWSPNSRYLAVAHTNSPYMGVWERSGTTFTKLSAPSSLPTGDANGIAWSANGEYLAVAHNTSPYVTIYRTAGTLPTSGFMFFRQVNDA